MRQDELVKELQMLSPMYWQRVWQMVVDYRQDYVKHLLKAAMDLLAQEEGFVRDALTLEDDAKTLTWQGVTARFTRTEYRLLTRLAEARGEWVARQALVKAVWGGEGEPSSDSDLLRSHIRNIRIALRRAGLDDQLVQAKAGLVRLAVPPECIGWRWEP